jgi:Tfp pilus assembly protein PilW
MKNIKCKSAICKCRHIAGFTLVEILVSLLVTAMLITAVAVAFNASVKNYNMNKDVFNAVNKARQTLTMITTQLRTANGVQTDSPSNECAFFDAANEHIIYQFNSSQNKLYVIKDTGTYLLCDGVDAMTFTRNLGDGGLYVESVQISMTVTSGDVQKTFSAAVVIRKNLR